MKNKKTLLAKNIVKKYAKKSVLKGIDLEVSQGEIVALLGPNGAGKTTFFYSLAGLTHPSSGNVFIDQKDITKYPIYIRGRMGISYLPQENSIFREMNVQDNILSIIELRTKNKQEKQEILANLLKEFKIEHIRKSKATSLSGGERRRVEIARCLATNPDFILFDEPFAGVDPIAVIDLKRIITYLKKKNIGIIITDHNVRETLDIVDKAYIIYEGKILFSGNKKDIINNKEVRNIYLGKNFK